MQVKSNSETERLVFHPRIPKLLEIASVSISVELWRRKMSIPNTSATSYYDILDDERFYDEKSLGIPRTMNGTVRKFIKQIKSALSRWMSIHCKIFTRYENDAVLLLTLYDDLIWYPNGAINYLKTVDNLLLSGKLTEWDKFKMVCEYCLENKVRKMWPSISKNESFDANSFPLYPTIRYWSLFMENKLDQLTAEEHIPVFMISSGATHIWWAAEYFWKQMSPEIKQERAPGIVYGWDGFCVREFLPMLNKQLLDEVIRSLIDDIIYKLSTEYWCMEHALEVWMYAKTMVTWEQFLRIFSILLSYENSVINSGSSYQELSPLLYEIWISASVDLKSYVLERHQEIYFSGGSRLLGFIDRSKDLDENAVLDLKDFRRDLRFISEFLASATVERKRDIWELKWPDLIILLPIHYVNELIKSIYSSEGEEMVRTKKAEMLKCHKTYFYFSTLTEQGCLAEVEDFLNFCTNDTREIVNFKREFFKFDKIESYCARLIVEGDTEKLEEVLKFFSNDTESVLDLKRQLTLSECFISNLLACNYDTKEKSIENEILNQVYPSAELLMEYKTTVVSSGRGLWCLGVLLRELKFDDVMNLVDSILDPSQLPDFRRKLSEEYLDIITNSIHEGFDPKLAERFLKWCLDSDQLVTEFKRLLDIEAIFMNYLENISLFQSSSNIRNNFEKSTLFRDFLLWCLGSEDAVRDEMAKCKEIISTFDFHDDMVLE